MLFTKRTLSIMALLTVSLGYGLLNVATRWLNLTLEPFTQVYLRIFIAMIATLFIFYKDIRWSFLAKLGLKEWATLIMMGVVGYGLMVYAITVGAINTSLLNVSVLFSTVPIFVFLLGVFFLKRKWDYLTLLILGTSIWGVGMLASGRLIPTLDGFGKGDIWVIISALFEAIWYLGIRLLAGKLNSREITFVAQTIASIVVFMLAVSYGEPLPTLADFASWQVSLGLFLGGAINVTAPLLTIFAFKYLDEVFATQLFLSENIFSLIVGYFFYGEMIGLVSLLGAVVVVASVYTLNKIQSD